MPFLNEENEPANTVKSIYETCDPAKINIVAIDDGSTKSLTKFDEFPEVQVIRNQKRLGKANCLNNALELIVTPHMLIIDGHMRFKNDGWLDKINSLLEKEPSTFFCTTSMQLAHDQMDITKASVKYFGADILFIDPSQKQSILAAQILEPKWTNEKADNLYEIQCILGANYAVNVNWYKRIKGMSGLEKWGGEEVFMSLKTWLAGGKCKLIKDIEIGHMYRSSAPYITQKHHLYYNKMWICFSLFDDSLTNLLLSKLPINHEYYLARKNINKNWSILLETRKYYKSIFTKSLQEICLELNISLPIS